MTLGLICASSFGEYWSCSDSLVGHIGCIIFRNAIINNAINLVAIGYTFSPSYRYLYPTCWDVSKPCHTDQPPWQSVHWPWIHGETFCKYYQSANIFSTSILTSPHYPVHCTKAWGQDNGLVYPGLFTLWQAVCILYLLKSCLDTITIRPKGYHDQNWSFSP